MMIVTLIVLALLSSMHTMNLVVLSLYDFTIVNTTRPTMAMLHLIGDLHASSKSLNFRVASGISRTLWAGTGEARVTVFFASKGDIGMGSEAVPLRDGDGDTPVDCDEGDDDTFIDEGAGTWVFGRRFFRDTGEGKGADTVSSIPSATAGEVCLNL
jgi:hypothetical protein